MESREEFLSEILRRLQRNYVHLVEIERLTKDMADSFSRNDRESVQLLLKMRGEELERAGEMKREIQLILQVLDDGEKEKYRSWLNAEQKYEPGSFEEKKIMELSGQIQQVLNRTISLDKILNSKVAGKESYYQTTS